MIAIESFPPHVVAVLDFIRQGSILTSRYCPSDDDSIVTTDIENSLSEYLDQDIIQPRFPLVEITQNASADIPFPKDQQGQLMRRSFIDFAEQENFYQKTLTKIIGFKEFSKDQAELIADAISNDFFLCAKSRLLRAEPHPYFEKIFSIYKRQGFPYGWVGQECWESGNFLIYSRTDG